MAGKYIFGFFRRRRVTTGHDLSRQLKTMAIWLALVFAAHVVAMMLLEGLSALDALWLTATTIMTVGYGDLSAKTAAGRVATMVLMYAGGIFVLAKAVADYAEWRVNVRERQAAGAWDWKMRNHLLLIGEVSGDVAQHVGRLVDQVRAQPEWARVEVLMLTRAFNDTKLPAVLAERGIVHVCGAPTDPAALEKAHPEDARAILVFAPSETDRGADAFIVDTILRLRERATAMPIVVECVDANDRARLLRLGASQAIRPMHGYPEMAARALVSPGAETLIENWFTAEGDECLRVGLDRPWRGPWNDLLRRVAEAGIGTLVGYAKSDGGVVSNPIGCEVEASALYVIVDDTRHPSAAAEIRLLLTAREAGEQSPPYLPAQWLDVR